VTTLTEEVHATDGPDRFLIPLIVLSGLAGISSHHAVAILEFIVQTVKILGFNSTPGECIHATDQKVPARDGGAGDS